MTSEPGLPSSATINPPPVPSRSLLPPAVFLLVAVVLTIYASRLIGAAFQNEGIPLKAPGTTEITIPHAGDYRIWMENQSFITDSTSRGGPALSSGTEIKVLEMPDEKTIELRPSNMTTNVNGRRSVAFAEMTMPSAGTYSVIVTGEGPEPKLALYEAKFFRSFYRAALCVIAAVILGLTGLVWGIIRLARRQAPVRA